jgi:hypothetical protein
MKYLITDPCYLLDLLSTQKERDNLWSYVCESIHDYDRDYDGTDHKDACTRMSDVLGLNILRISDTGFGDWSNTITSTSKHINVLIPEFYADAGMMCVVEINEKLENFLKEHDIGAIFESDVPISVSVNDEERGWYVLEIMDEKGWNKLAESQPPYEEDEDEEFYRRWGYYPWEEDEQEELEDDPYEFEDDDVRC